MKFTIENVGPIKKSEMEFGDLTILCGKNNTGKTYITYNTFNFFDAIRYFLRLSVDKNLSEKLLETGKISIDLSEYFSIYHTRFKTIMADWVKTESWRQMASHKDHYANAEMFLEYDTKEFEIFANWREIKTYSTITKNCILHIQKERKNCNIDFTLENTGTELPNADMLHKHLEGFLSFVFNSYFPDTFIITCERTGVACFRPSFIYSPPKKVSVSERDEYDEDAPKYPRPMQKDWRFVVEFRDAAVEKSFIAEEYPYILDYFSDICGGNYKLNDDLVFFEPKASPGVKLTTTESSSTVRSLMELNFYLKHKAQKYQCLIIDEPELNLHPENQRKMARLLAMLVNAGIYVAITTHSDYIIKEFNTLLMLNYEEDPRMEEMQKKYSYSKDELLNADKVRVYCAQDETVVPVTVSQDSGIAISSFDDTIRQMAYMQRDILMGGEQNA